jgi:hypothetical protein
MLALIFAPPLVLSFGVPLALVPAFILYLLSLSASIVLYRISPFHPLAKCPGPLLARVSRVYWSFASSSGLPHIRMQQLHEKYGDIVRTGPNHLSIRDAAAIPAIFGARGPWAKHGSAHSLLDHCCCSALTAEQSMTCRGPTAAQRRS